MRFHRRDAREHDAARDGEQSGNRERGAPAQELDGETGRKRGERDAQVSGQAVDADRPARAIRGLQQHRNADRVVDRCERAEQRQRDRHLPCVLRRGGEQRRGAHAEEEDQHHRPAAPQVAQPARRNGAQAEQQERRGAVGHQLLPRREAEVRGDHRNRGGEDQQEHVVDRVRDVEQQRGAARMRGQCVRRRRRGRHGRLQRGDAFRDQLRAAIDEARVDLHERRAGGDLLARVLPREDAADADDRQRAVQRPRQLADHCCRPLAQRGAGKAARSRRHDASPSRRRGRSSCWSR